MVTLTLEAYEQVASALLGKNGGDIKVCAIIYLQILSWN
jgi:hypothetical protein